MGGEGVSEVISPEPPIENTGALSAPNEGNRIVSGA